ncbi:hypothetical protein SDC9_112190 [bioreactor metagenome]|uniref:Uncharacterized protein n=1 Tax=bioreactor metagenome TaxID=1076179 RepID=A0A645BIS4_9ZZZZ
MTDFELVMNALLRICKSGNGFITGRIQKGFLASGQHFMDIGLMRDIKDDFIMR